MGFTNWISSPSFVGVADPGEGAKQQNLFRYTNTFLPNLSTGLARPPLVGLADPGEGAKQQNLFRLREKQFFDFPLRFQAVA